MSRAPFVLAFALALAPACANDPTPPPPDSKSGAKAALPDRDPALAHKLVGAGGLLIDVRSPGEFAGKHVEGAINIPIGELERRLPEVEKLAGGDKNKPIVVYCEMGGRASQAKKILVNSGYEQVTNLGGISDWYRN